MTELFQIAWPGPCVMDDNSGLWDNDGRISIHVPLLRLLYDVAPLFRFGARDIFFVEYASDGIQPMTLEYIALSDMTFIDRVYDRTTRACVYTTLKPI